MVRRGLALPGHREETAPSSVNVILKKRETFPNFLQQRDDEGSESTDVEEDIELHHTIGQEPGGIYKRDDGSTFYQRTTLQSRTDSVDKRTQGSLYRKDDSEDPLDESHEFDLNGDGGNSINKRQQFDVEAVVEDSRENGGPKTGGMY